MSSIMTQQTSFFAHWTAGSALAAPAPPPAHRPGVSESSSNSPQGLKLCVLGSGSGGNSTVVRSPAGTVLIDAGFGPRTIARRLGQAGMALADISAICLTHLDQDHFRPTWVRTLLQCAIPLWIDRWHVEDLYRLPEAHLLEEAGLLRTFEGCAFSPLPSTTEMVVHPVRLPHDLKGANGFVVRTSTGSIGYATDLGHVPRELIEQFAGVGVLAIESNYDPEMEQSSSRPAFLKHRIMGGRGHLSNLQAFEAVQAISRASPTGMPQQVVLLHRSQQCNCPDLVRRVFAQDPALARRVILTEQRRRSRWVEARPIPAGTAAQMQLTY
jgi:phosphoribosyl 1,2-cyclic phosphodiesterase